MSHKIKGINTERDLIHKFWSTGTWSAVRVAGSGSMRYPGPDLLVGSREKNRRLAIECKSTIKDRIYLDNHDVEQLNEFSEIFDARAWFAVKFPRKDWLFLSPEDIVKTPKGYVIEYKVAELRGISFEELIKYKI